MLLREASSKSTKKLTTIQLRMVISQAKKATFINIYIPE